MGLGSVIYQRGKINFFIICSFTPIVIRDEYGLSFLNRVGKLKYQDPKKEIEQNKR